jgi:Flp pilus assembly protein TadB
VLASRGLPSLGIHAGLAVLGRDRAAQLAEKGTAAAVGLLIAVAFLAAGIRVPVIVPAWAALASAAAGFLAPDAAVRAEAARHALAAFVDLATIALAGGAGIDQALSDAAANGGG